MKTPPRSVNRKLLYALATVGVLVLAFVFVVNPLLLGGGDDAVPPLPPPASEPDDGDAVAEDAEEEDVPEAYEVFSARDPFQQLVTAEDGSPGAGSTPVPVGDDPAPAAGARTVGLERVLHDPAGTRRAVVTVDGAVHEPAEGEVFAEIRVASIADQCVTLERGDERIALCAGEEARL